MIAQLSPAIRHILKNVAVILSLSGKPKEILEIPRLVQIPKRNAVEMEFASFA